MSGERYSLSFRRMIPPAKLVVDLPNVGDSSCVSGNPVLSSADNSAQLQAGPKVNSGTGHSIPSSADSAWKKPERKRTTVLFGTSITTRIPNNEVTGRGRKFVNISERGARVQDINRLVENFHACHQQATDVEKVILSFGTNDIKHDSSKSGVNKLRVPIGDLLANIKNLFPGAIILVQSVLPMRNLYWYTARNVLGLNKLYRELCNHYNCVYVDCFRDFLSKDRRDHNKGLFSDHFHLNYYGRRVLCHWLRCLVNSSSFDRVVY